MLVCTVRGCGAPLAREGAAMRCANGHSFDCARSGYLNLLQPQDRRSRVPGDSMAAVAARRRLHDRGLTAPFVNAIGELLTPGDTVLDVGCGEGFYLGTLAARIGFRSHGVDISTPAIEAAARRFPGVEWTIANADRFLPYADRSFSAALSITARLPVSELRRVLRREGRLIAALAAPDDLIELRGEGRDRVARTIAECSPAFRLRSQRRVTIRAALDPAGVEDVRLAIYRPLGVRAVSPVTFSLDILEFGG
ncbi:MAG: methyltransferase domain-containing protein [Acidobacteria bacterium]|nr:methyltransferase domain-containing protein [Acidobacteriota bacterium]